MLFRPGAWFSPSADGRSTLGRRLSARRFDLLVVFGLALAVRLLLVGTSSGGFSGDAGYDPSVYFAAADAFTHGRLPYGDFLLLHPPGMMLALTPFALLARLTGDHPAFVTANVVCIAVGALNAALVYRIAEACQLPRRAALAGGIFYALWLSAAGPELSARLEPLGTLAFLCGVLALSRSLVQRVRPTRRAAVGAGVALGAACAVKVWWIAPLLVLLGTYAFVRRDGATTRRMLAGAVATLVVVLGPFFVLAPHTMWRMVVSDELNRSTRHTLRLQRIVDLSSLNQYVSSRSAGFAVAAVVAVVALAIGVAAWRQRAARPLVVVAVVQVLILVAPETYNGYYSGYLAPTAALLVAAAAATRERRRARLSLRLRLRLPVTALAAALVAVVVAVAGCVTVSALATTPGVATPGRLDVGALPGDVRSVNCVVSDSPMALIALDALSRGLAADCPNWVDVTGRTYDVAANPGRHVARSRNPAWQRDLRAYLLCGEAVVIVRRATGLGPTLQATIDALPVLARNGYVVVRRVPEAARQHCA